MVKVRTVDLEGDRAIVGFHGFGDLFRLGGTLGNEPLALGFVGASAGHKQLNMALERAIAYIGHGVHAGDGVVAEAACGRTFRLGGGRCR